MQLQDLKNLKFFLIYEPTPGDNTSDVDEIVATLNHFSAKKTWKNSDIDSTHRIGQLDKNSHAPRPLIVTFCQPDDKLSILRDRDLRDGLRRECIRISTDPYTTPERAGPTSEEPRQSGIF